MFHCPNLKRISGFYRNSDWKSKSKRLKLFLKFSVLTEIIYQGSNYENAVTEPGNLKCFKTEIKVTSNINLSLLEPKWKLNLFQGRVTSDSYIYAEVALFKYDWIHDF